MRTLLSPVPSAVLQKQLHHCRFLKSSTRGQFELYLFRHHEVSPLLLEIGRLREMSFRSSGSGTGKAYDLDSYDTGVYANYQLIAWDAIEKKIAGGYRLQHFLDAYDGNGEWHLPSAELFRYNEEFIRRYLNRSMEAGRSWIHPEYQSSRSGSRSIYVLDALWEGIGHVVQTMPGTAYVFGKVSIPRSYPTHVRDLIIGFFNAYHGSQRDWVPARVPLNCSPHIHMFFDGLSRERAMTELRKTIEFYGFRLPPLVSAYLKLSDEVQLFGSTLNHSCGNVADTAILVDISKIRNERIAGYFQHTASQNRVA